MRKKRHIKHDYTRISHKNYPRLSALLFTYIYMRFFTLEQIKMCNSCIQFLCLYSITILERKKYINAYINNYSKVISK